MGSSAWEAGEKRRKAEERKRRVATPAHRRRRVVAWIAVTAVAAGGLFLASQQAGEPRECPGHWHSSFAVFIDGQRVTFPQPPYSYEREGGRLPFSMHMHRPNQEQLHFEPPSPRCQDVEATMRLLDLDLEKESIMIEGSHEGAPYAGLHENEGNRTLRITLQAFKGQMREPPIAEVLGYQLRDGEKMLITYGTYSPAEMQAMMDTIGLATGQ